MGLCFVLVLTAINSIYYSISFAFGSDTGTYLFRGDFLGDFFKIIFSYPKGHVFTQGLMGRLPAILRDYAVNNPYQGIEAFQNGGLSHFHLPPFTTAICLLSIDAFKLIGYRRVFFLILAFCFFIVYFFTKDISHKKTDRLLIFLIAISSYPFLFMLQRGNFIAFASSIFTIMALLYLRRCHSYGAALLMAVAINMRPNLIIFAPLFFFWSKDGLKSLISLFMLSAALFGLSLLYSHAQYPDYTVGNFLKGLQIYQRMYVIGDSAFGYSSSMYTAIKYLLKLAHWTTSLSFLIKVISGFLLILVSYAAYLYYCKKLNDVEFVYLLTASTMLGTPIFADYHLFIFILPILFLLRNNADMFVMGWKKNAMPTFIFVSSCFMLSPMNYYDFNGLYVASLLKTLIVLILCFAIFNTARNRSEVTPHSAEGAM